MTPVSDDTTTDQYGPVGLLIFEVMRVIGTALAGMGAASAGDVALMQQYSLSDLRPTLLTPPDATEALRRGEISPEQYTNTMGRLGFSDRAIDAMRALSYQLLDVGSLVELRKRGTVDRDEYEQRAAQLGYTVEDAERLFTLGIYIPTAQDVVQFAVREVYTPEIAQRYGQFEDFPTDALGDFGRAGLTEENARKYWAAHWQLPSFQEAIQMYHRRAETGFQLDDVMQLLRALDVMPFYREKLIAIASAPYTRVDVRRMHKLGILTLDQVADAYQALGYDDERAHNLAIFTEKLNNKESDDELEPFRAGLRGKVITLYEGNNLSRSVLEGVLRDLGYQPDQIAAFIAQAEFIRVADEYADYRESIRKLYVGEHWSREQAITKLHDLGHDEAEIAQLIPVWDLQRELREQTDADRHEKDLTKAEIIAAYKDAIMTLAETEESLQQLGYDDHEVTRLVKLADTAILKATRTDVEATAHTLFVAGRIGDAAARGQLAAVGLGAQRIEALLVKWQGEVAAKTPELTVAQIQAALRVDLIDTADADRRLTRLGYSVEDRSIIIALA